MQTSSCHCPCQTLRSFPNPVPKSLFSLLEIPGVLQPNPDSFPGPSPQRSLQAHVTTCVSGPPATLWATGHSALCSVASYLPRAGVPCMSQHLHLPRLSSPFQAQGGGHFCDGIPRMLGLAINSSFLYAFTLPCLFYYIDLVLP